MLAQTDPANHHWFLRVKGSVGQTGFIPASMALAVDDEEEEDDEDEMDEEEFNRQCMVTQGMVSPVRMD